MNHLSAWNRPRTCWLLLAAGLAMLACAAAAGSLALGAGAVCVCLLSGGALLAAARRGVLWPGGPTAPHAACQAASTPQPAPPAGSGPKAADTASLVEEMLAQDRYALLLRPQILPNLSPEQRAKAQSALAQGMARVPAGKLTLGLAHHEGEEDELAEGASSRTNAVVRVEEFLLDCFAVTNRQFQAFVEAGGYQQMAIWERHIWPAVKDFVDQTGRPGPRYWKNGRPLPGTEKHPVTGVCWYEAAAYARWVGKRLPTDAEWEKAASWPIQVSAHSFVQRRYPWGASMQRSRANIWGSGPGTTVPVDAFPEGVSVGGVHQLIGNVWEWTSDNFDAVVHDEPGLLLPVPMKSIRGGAFDTYFPNQATCQFQSAESLLGRKHNIGFRCALSACDLQPAEAPQGQAQADGRQGAVEHACLVASA